MKQKTGQKLEIKQKPTVRQEVDIIDAQSIAAKADAIAYGLLTKNDGDIEKVEKDITDMEFNLDLSSTPELNIKEQILWSAKWIKKHSFLKPSTIPAT